MKTLLKILPAGLLLAAITCTEKGSEAENSAATCGICHAIPPRDVSHSFHVETLQNKCSYCHTGYAAETLITISRTAPGGRIDTAYNYHVNDATHMNGDTDVVLSFPWNDSGRAAYDPGLTQCSNVYCHGAIPQGTRATVKWVGGTPIDLRCYACHDSAGIANYHYGHGRTAVYTATATNPKVRGGTVQRCYKCHGDSLDDTTSYSVITKRVNPTKHLDGAFDRGVCWTCHASELEPWTTWKQYQAINP